MNSSKRSPALLLAVGIFLALVVRYRFIFFETNDYSNYLSTWYNFIKNRDNIEALRDPFSNHNMPYLYLLTMSVVLFPVREAYTVIVIKVISIIFDIMMASFAYECVRMKYHESKMIPIMAALATLFAPTVILNSAAWAQSDAIYTTFLVACLYALLARRQAWAFIAFGLAFSFKLQALFLAPLFLWLLIKKTVNWRCFFLSPLVYLITLIPAWLIGRPLGDMLLIYIRQSQQYEFLTHQAPNLYQWIPNAYYDLYPLGVVFTVIVVLIIAWLLSKSRVKVTEDLLVHLATFSVLLLPYILPKMHDRYFFSADVIAIIFAFYFPKYWYIPIGIGLASLNSYLAFLYGVLIVPLELMAIIPATLIAVLGWQLLRDFNTPPANTLVQFHSSERP